MGKLYGVTKTCSCDSCVAEKPVHGTPEPQRVPSDAQCLPPAPCDFRVGDRVVYTNDHGVSFDLAVTGFSPKPEPDGRFVYLNKGSWWFPVKPGSLQHWRSDE